MMAPIVILRKKHFLKTLVNEEHAKLHSKMYSETTEIVFCSDCKLLRAWKSFLFPDVMTRNTLID